MLMTQSMAEDFTAPIPPPELGDNLTGYRTKQQILEQNIRDDMERNPPQMRVHRKDGTTVTVTDGTVPGSVGNDGSVSPGTVYTDTGDAPAKSARTVIRDKFIYSQGRMFKLYDNASLVFRIKDGGDVSWPLSRVECSNNGFRVQMNKHHDSVRILPDSRQINMANIKVYLKVGYESASFKECICILSHIVCDIFCNIVDSCSNIITMCINFTNQFHAVK